MFGNAHLDQVRQAFAEQFSGDGHNFIYRKYQKGVPVRVSNLERHGFVAEFNKRIRFAMWSIVPATVGLILLLAWLTPDTDSPAAQIAMWAASRQSFCPSWWYFTGLGVLHHASWSVKLRKAQH